jgi:hypothetical protein
VVAAAVIAGCSGNGSDEQVDFVQRPDSRLVKVQTVGLAAFGPIIPHSASAADAAAAFGEPSAVGRRGAACERRWNDLGLTIEFAAAGGEDACGEDAGIEAIRLHGIGAEEAGWRTAEGIRPGMAVSAARRIYPEARRSGGRLILVRGPAGCGSGVSVTVLSARTAGGRLAELTFPIGE